MASIEPQRGRVSSTRYALPALFAGVALLGLSFLPILASGRDRWTKEQALELQQASLRIQELTHKLGSQTPDTASKRTATDYQDALNHFQDLQTELKDARGRTGSLKAVMRIVGLLLVVVGASGFATTRRRNTADLRPVHTVRTP
ncbi:MAG: hypothetical protein AB7G28_00695 [Pirellulales bacterium]